MAKDTVEQDPIGPRGWVQSSRDYVEDVKAELRKVTFPQRKEAVAGTIGVLVVVGVITLVLAFADMILAWGVGKVLP
jgi:preprotein translocase subunit SecE